jgi:hypothetical protein
LVDGHSLCYIQDGENDRPMIHSIDGRRTHILFIFEKVCQVVIQYFLFEKSLPGWG